MDHAHDDKLLQLQLDKLEEMKKEAMRRVDREGF